MDLGCGLMNKLLNDATIILKYKKYTRSILASTCLSFCRNTKVYNLILVFIILGDIKLPIV